MSRISRFVWGTQDEKNIIIFESVYINVIFGEYIKFNVWEEEIVYKYTNYQQIEKDGSHFLVKFTTS